MTSLTEQIIPRRKLLLILCETVLITAILLLGTSIPPLASRAVDLFEPSRELLRGLLTCLTIAVICQAALSYSDLYYWKTSQNRAELSNRLVHSCGYALLMLAALVLLAPSLFYFPGFADVGRETLKLIALVGVVFLALYLFRNAFHWFFYKWRFGERVVVLGSAKEALQIARMIVDHPMAGFEVVGIVEEPDQPPLERLPHDPPLLGGLQSLREFCRDEGISRVVVSLRERRGRLPSELLLECRMDGVLIEEREAMYERITGKLAVESMRPSYLIYGRGFAKDPLTLATKRVLDILAASIGLLVSLPISLLAALAVKLTSPGPVFFTQERVGEDGRLFRVIKFRTMRSDAEKHTGPVWAQKNDARVTSVGKFLRVTRIDEIPQFLNILRGQMSFVGPRPERPHFVEQLNRDIPFYMLRHTVKPGLTGWAQVCHPYGASVDDAREKLRFDLYYIKNLGLLFDLNIILRTVAVILSGKGAR
ncbi:MAG: putative undecaprenyl-phosphate N-acetylgalactosaminyl 1-phosphate transferase [Planctomycetota bacterium]